MDFWKHKIIWKRCEVKKESFWDLTQCHLMAKLNNPQDKVKFIQVAGTNGKGSTAAYLTSILSETGIKKVGRYTSRLYFQAQSSISHVEAV